MDSEDYSATENSSLHQEKGQNYHDTSSHHEGSIRVPIPCGVSIVALITVLIIALVALSVGQYNCPGQYHQFSAPAGSHVSPCSDEWIRYQKKCYFFSSTTKSWTSAKASCSQDGATLAVIDSEKEMIFLKRYAGRGGHWIGLDNRANETWKSSNGREFDPCCQLYLSLEPKAQCPQLKGDEATHIAAEAKRWLGSKCGGEAARHEGARDQT
ncbi:early activation antigen CD69-like [Ctenodactylus gundi]